MLVYDWSEAQNNGTVYGNASHNSSGRFGGSYGFDGSGDYVNLGRVTDIEGLSEFSFSVWLKADNISGFPMFLVKTGGGNDWGFARLEGGQVYFRLYDESGTTHTGVSSTSLQVGNWYNIVGVLNLTSVTVYVNGVNGTSASWPSGNVTYNDHNMLIGSSFDGSIDELLFFTRSLKQQEILALYNSSAYRYENNFTGLDDGIHTFTGYAVDTNGDLNYTSERTVTTDGGIPPGVTINSPENTTYGPFDFPLVYNVTLSEEGSVVLYTLTNGAYNYSMSSLDGFSWNASNASLPTGAYTFQVYANDTSGGRNDSESVSFSVDMDSPLVVINSPLNTAYNESLIEINISLNEQGSCNYSVNNGLTNNSMTTTDNLTFTSTHFFQDVRNYTLNAYCTDALGNENSTESVNFFANVPFEAFIDLMNSNSTKIAPAVVHVHGTNSTGVGEWHKSKFEWDFDYTNQESSPLTTIDYRTGQEVDVAKEQKGFNGAYIYQEAGNYTIELNITNSSGSSITTYYNITILPDTREVRYVDSSGGDDSNNGTSEGFAWKTFNHSISQLTDNMTLKFKAGQTFNIDHETEIVNDNVILGRYGSGDKPVIYWNGSDGGQTLLGLDSESENVIIRNLEFSTPFIVVEGCGGGNCSTIRAIGSSGTLVSAWNSTFVNLSSIFRPVGGKGILLLNNIGGKTTRYHSFVTADDFVAIGEVADDSIEESIVRTGTVNRINLQWVNFNQSDLYKSLVRYNGVTYGHIYQSKFHGGGILLSQDETGADWIVFDGIIRSGESLDGGALDFAGETHNFMMRNSIFNGTESISTTNGCNAAGNFTIENLSFMNNLFMVPFNVTPPDSFLYLKSYEGYDTTKFCDYETQVSGIEIANNLFSYNSSLLNDPRIIQVSCTLANASGEFDCLTKTDSINDITYIKNNVYPNISGSVQFLSFNGTRYNWSEWQSISFTSNESLETVYYDDLISSNYRPNSTLYPITTSNALPINGVFEDYHGNPRPGGSNITWYAGAVGAELGGSGNDTTNPSATLVSPIGTLNTTTATQNFIANFTDNTQLTNNTFYLWNSTNNIINTTTTIITGTTNQTNLSVTLPYEGTFTWNYQAYDNSSNSAFATSNYTITYDATNPSTASYTGSTPNNASTVTSNSITVQVTANDTLSGIANITVYLYNATGGLVTSETDTGSSASATFTSLSNTDYSFNATATDYAGNTNNTETRQITVSVTTPAGSGSSGGGGGGSSGGGGGGSTTATFWKTTHVHNETDLKDKKSLYKILGIKERIHLLINNKTHHVGIINKTNTTVTINVSSITQQKEIAEGETKTFDLELDGTQDIEITVNKILETGATITIRYLEPTITEETNKQQTEEETTNEENNEETKMPRKNLVWIGILLMLTMGIPIIILLVHHKKTKKK